MRGPRPTKHTAYYELLDALRDAVRCPLCKVEADSMKRYFESLLHESVNDPEIRAKLARSQGYCHRHAHYLRNHGSRLGIAILYEDQIRLFLRSLEELETITSKVTRNALRTRRRPEVCPACRVQNDCRSRYCSILIEWLYDQELLSALHASCGFCIPHFQRLLDMPMDTKARSFLIEMQRERMTSLLQEVEEFHRKHDYRFRHEGFGNESDSWSRAISMVVGEEEVF